MTTTHSLIQNPKDDVMNIITNQAYVDIELVHKKFKVIENLTNHIINQLTPVCDQINVSKTTFKRIRYVAIELLQNVMKYTFKSYNSICEFKIVKKKEEYHIQCHNTVSLQQKLCLQANITYLNSLSQKDLKMHYLSTLSNTMFNNEGGAGLGFMSILLKSSSPLYIDFEPISMSQYQFKITVILPIEK